VRPYGGKETPGLVAAQDDARVDCLRVRGLFHLTFRKGLSGKAWISIAYCIALFNVMRLRFAVLAAAGLPSFVLLMRSSRTRTRAGPVSAFKISATGSVLDSSQRCTALKLISNVVAVTVI
jgi:hypothetical protein